MKQTLCIWAGLLVWFCLIGLAAEFWSSRAATALFIGPFFAAFAWSQLAVNPAEKWKRRAIDAADKRFKTGAPR